MDSIDKAMNKAKIQLMSRKDSAFFTTVCFSLKFEWDDKIPTAATNGKYLKFNPKFFMELSPDERVFLLVHESCHVAYLHMDRVQTRDRRKWNIAADHVINLMLLERGFRMPMGKYQGFADEKYKNMSTEEVYKLLEDDPSGSYDCDIEPSDLESDELIQEVQDILVRAQVQAQLEDNSPNAIPGDIRLFLDRLLKPKLPWNRILQKYLQNFSKNDYTFKRLNRRFFPQHYLPSLYSNSLMDIAIAVDISGSVSDADFKQIVTEVSSILRMMKPEKITLIQFDTEIKHIDVIKDIKDLMNVKFTGRGGTAIYQVIEWMNTNKPQLTLMFTDGEFHFYDLTTKAQTVWIVHNNLGFKPPFGKVINYKI